jgi:hypothetical protein
MAPELPPGPFPLLEALIAYGDPDAVRQRRKVERYARQPAIDRFSDFRITSPEDDSPTIIYPESQAQTLLAETRERLVLTFLERVKAEHIFLRGVPATLPPGSPKELIPNGWAMDLELRIDDSSVRRLGDRWVAVVATTFAPRADELATCRRLVEESERQVVGRLPDGTFPLRLALLELTDPTAAGAFVAAETEMSRFRQIVAGRVPPDLQGKVLIGLDKVSRDLAEHRLADILRRARSAVTADFLARVQDGRIILTGLQTHPQLALGRSRLSPEWAPHMIFDWDRQAVRVVENVYVDVQGEARRPAPLRKLGSTRPKAAQGRGRPSFPFDRFVEIASSSTWQRASHNKIEVDRLLSEYRQRYPGSKLPSDSTVMSHIGRIYAAVADAAAPVKSRKPK